MAKKSRSRLRAIFSSLREKGKLVKQAYQTHKTKKLYKNFNKANKEFFDIHKKTHGGLVGFNDKELERLRKEITLMKEVGLWKENPSKKEQLDRIKHIHAIGVLEHHIRQDFEEEQAKKTSISDLLNAALGTGIFETKYKPKYDIEASLAHVPPQVMDKIGSKIKKDATISASKKIDLLFKAADEGRITPLEAQHKAQKLLDLIKKRREAKEVLEGGEEPAHRKLKTINIGGSRGKERKRETLDAYSAMMKRRGYNR